MVDSDPAATNKGTRHRENHDLTLSSLSASCLLNDDTTSGVDGQKTHTHTNRNFVTNTANNSVQHELVQICVTRPHRYTKVKQPINLNYDRTRELGHKKHSVIICTDHTHTLFSRLTIGREKKESCLRRDMFTFLLYVNNQRSQ